MQLTSFQNPEIRGSSDQILQAGAYGKNSAFVNAQNTGILDYINNNLMYLYNDRSNHFTKTEADNRYLKLSGGTISGNIIINGNLIKTVNTSRLELCGGTTLDDGASVLLYGSDRTDGNDGSFQLACCKVENDVPSRIRLVGKPNGDLIWNGRKIAIAGDYLSSNGGTVSGTITTETNSSFKRKGSEGFLQLGFETVLNGARLNLFGKDYSNTQKGGFQLMTGDGSATQILGGSTNGSLTWNGKEVERVNSSGTNYIRYESGLQICWGIQAVTQATTFTFPQGFKTAPALSLLTNGSANAYAVSLSATSFSGRLSSYATAQDVRYIAIGYWK